MKTTTLVILGLMAALAFAGGGAAAETTSTGLEGACEPFYVDNEGKAHVNADCIGPATADAGQAS